MNNFIEELSKRLCGKTVISVERPKALEAIALFVMSDGSRFRIHATDLGSWIEDTSPAGKAYQSLDMLMRDYYYHCYISNLLGDGLYPSATIDNGFLNLEAPDGSSFKGEINQFTKEDQQLVNHPDGCSILQKCSELGEIWKTYLNHLDFPEICPPELCRDSKLKELGFEDLTEDEKANIQLGRNLT